MDLYEILEIKSNASESEIKKAYYRLAKIYHPDKNSSPEAQLKFQKINSAYEILINDKSRIEYNKMNGTQKNGFNNYLEKIINIFKTDSTDEAICDLINNTIDINEFSKYGINKQDMEYIQKNIINFFKSINVKELFGLIKNGTVPRKNFSNTINCSESDMESYDEMCAEYYYTLPISLQQINPLDIRLELSIKLGDITSNSKRKIKIKRKINNELDTQTFIFNLSSPYVVFYGAGDSIEQNYGNLIIKLVLPNNLIWNIDKWVPSRDGFYININANINSILAIKLFLNYEDTEEKEKMMKQYFS